MLKKQTKKIITSIISLCLIISMVITYAPLEVSADEGGTARLKFSKSDLEHGTISYKIGEADAVELDAETADPGGAIWVDDITSGQTVVITATPNDGYVISDIKAAEGEEENAPSAYGADKDLEAGTYSFTMSDETYVVSVQFGTPNPGGGDPNPGGGDPNPGGGDPNPGGGDPGSQNTASLKFSSNDLTNGKIFYQIGNDSRVEITIADAVNGAIWINDLTADNSTVTIYAEPNEGYEVDNISVKEGELESSPAAYNGSFDSENEKYTFPLTGNTFAVYVNFVAEGSSGGGDPNPGGGDPNPGGGDPNPGGGDPNPGGSPSPEHYSDAGYISMDTHNDVSGKIYYAFAASRSAIAASDWTQLSTENNYYLPIDMSQAGSGDKLYLRIAAGSGKHLDVDGGFSISADSGSGSTKLFKINGTYNDDPNYNVEVEGAQPNGIGLNDLYDNVNDVYVVEYDIAGHTGEALHAELKWTNVMTITVSVDDASQYMLSSGKVEIGIATGKGFKTKVEDGSTVSIPVLEDADFEGEPERYLIDLKINPEYFIPQFTFNGNSYETFDANSGTSEYTSVAAAVPAAAFKQLIASGSNELVIHLTVDKNVGVTDSNGDESGIHADFRMIDDGDIPENTDVADLDADISLEAEAATVSSEDSAAGILDAYDIQMEIDGTAETEFYVPINISLPGDYDDEAEYKVVREHEGEDTQELDCEVVDGGIVFRTDKFSKFSVKMVSAPHTHTGIKVNQVNSTCAKYGTKAYYKCDCGKFFTNAACTNEITDLAAWKAGAGRIAKAAHKYTVVSRTAATTTKNGTKKVKCSVCKAETTQTIYAAKTVSISCSKYTYDGKEKKPTVTVKDSKGNVVSTSNYTVSYTSGRKIVGTYTVTITFKNDYKGSVKKTYVINPPKTAISSLTAGKKAFTAKWTKKSTQVTGYQIMYSTSSKFASGNKTETVTSYKTASKTISSLTGGKKYYVKIRTYKTVGKTKYYSDWSAVKAVTTKK